MSAHFIVYQSRNRMTGTLTQTLDTKHKDSTLVLDAKKGRYAARCVEHNKIVFFAEHYAAGRAIAHVNEWCPKCKLMIAKGKKVKSEGIVNNAMQPITGDDRHHAHDKRHNEHGKNGDAPRSKDQAKMYEINHKSMHTPDGNLAANVATEKRVKKARRASVTRTVVEPVSEPIINVEPVAEVVS